jgi:3-oxoadipate enol-lactonase
VMVLPFGMPLDLCLDWFTDLGTRHHVITWETRCLFGDCANFDAARIDLDAQIDDLFAVMQHFRLSNAQVMGICGGAVIALAAAARPGEHFRSLSLWYGDYPFAEAGLRTKHQANFEWMMETASQTREEAGGLQSMFVDPSMLATTPAEIAHLSLYPYVNGELLYRYARLNDALNKTNIMSWFPRISVPTLVVTGDNDETTHAGGSIFVADRITDAQLHVEPGGSHTAFFGKPASLASLAYAFLHEHASGMSVSARAAGDPELVDGAHTEQPEPSYQ